MHNRLALIRRAVEKHWSCAQLAVAKQTAIGNILLTAPTTLIDTIRKGVLQALQGEAPEEGVTRTMASDLSRLSKTTIVTKKEKPFVYKGTDNEQRGKQFLNLLRRLTDDCVLQEMLTQTPSNILYRAICAQLPPESVEVLPLLQLKSQEVDATHLQCIRLTKHYECVVRDETGNRKTTHSFDVVYTIEQNEERSTVNLIEWNNPEIATNSS